jgi:hypothetical protein
MGLKTSGAKAKPGKPAQQGENNSAASGNGAGKKKSTGPSNTGPIFYFSNANVRKSCVKEKAAIQKHCGDDKEETKKTAKSAKFNSSKLGAISGKVQTGLEAVESTVKAGYGYKRNKKNAWIDDHCHGLWIKPQAAADQFDHFKGELVKIEEKLNKDISNVLKDAGGKAVDLAKDKMLDFGKKAAVREGTSLVSLAIPVVGEVVVAGTTVWNVVDGVWTAGKVTIEALSLGGAALAKYKELAPQLKKVEDLLSGKLTPSTVLAEMMTALATTNPCIQARRCSLVQFDETEGKKLPGAVEGSSSGKIQAATGKGCCPGQTGHHVLPGAMFDMEKKPCGKDYNHSLAPVICLEGTNNIVGSHGAAHLALDRTINIYRETKGDLISYNEARRQGISAVRQINPHCSEKCMQAQLDKFYKDGMNCGEEVHLKANSGKAIRVPAEKDAIRPSRSRG